MCKINSRDLRAIVVQSTIVFSFFTLLFLGILSCLEVSWLKSVGILGGAIMIPSSFILPLIKTVHFKKIARHNEFLSSLNALTFPPHYAPPFPPHFPLELRSEIFRFLSPKDLARLKVNKNWNDYIKKYVLTKATSHGFTAKAKDPKKFLDDLANDTINLWRQKLIPTRFISLKEDISLFEIESVGISTRLDVEKTLYNVRKGQAPLTSAEIFTLYRNKNHHFPAFSMFLLKMTQDQRCVHDGVQRPQDVTIAWAAFNNDGEAVKLLSLHGGDPLFVPPHTNGASPLYWALRNKNIDLVLFLLQRGMDPNSQLDLSANSDSGPAGSVLNYAIWSKFTSGARALLYYGADANQVDYYLQDELHKIL